MIHLGPVCRDVFENKGSFLESHWIVSSFLLDLHPGISLDPPQFRGISSMENPWFMLEALPPFETWKRGNVPKTMSRWVSWSKPQERIGYLGTQHQGNLGSEDGSTRTCWMVQKSQGQPFYFHPENWGNDPI